MSKIIKKGSLLEILMELVDDIDKPDLTDEYEKLLKSNTHIMEFRELLINRAWAIEGIKHFKLAEGLSTCGVIFDKHRFLMFSDLTKKEFENIMYIYSNKEIVEFIVRYSCYSSNQDKDLEEFVEQFKAKYIENANGTTMSAQRRSKVENITKRTFDHLNGSFDKNKALFTRIFIDSPNEYVPIITKSWCCCADGAMPHTKPSVDLQTMIETYRNKDEKYIYVFFAMLVLAFDKDYYRNNLAIVADFSALLEVNEADINDIIYIVKILFGEISIKSIDVFTSSVQNNRIAAIFKPCVAENLCR